MLFDWSAICFTDQTIVISPRGTTNDRIDRAANSDASHIVHALDPAGAGRNRHDVDLQSAICLDPVHQIFSGRSWRLAGRHPVDILDFDHPANLAVAVTGLSGR